MKFIQFSQIGQSCTLFIYFCFGSMRFHLILLGIGIIIQCAIIKWKKYDRFGSELAFIFMTIPMGFTQINPLVVLISMIQQLSISQSVTVVFRCLYLIIMAIIQQSQELLEVIVLIIFFLFFGFYRIMEYHKYKGQNRNIFDQKSPIAVKRSYSQEYDNSSKLNIQRVQSDGQYFQPCLKNYFQQIIEEFPEGVALVIFDKHQQPVVDFCNQTMLKLLETTKQELMETLGRLKDLQIWKPNEVQNFEKSQQDIGLSNATFKSFGQSGVSTLGVARLNYRASTHVGQRKDGSLDISKSFRFSKNLFENAIEQATLQIHKIEVQYLLSKAQISFDLHTILIGYIKKEIANKKQRGIEIKIFISFLNEQPSLLILIRDVSYRDYIKNIHLQSKAKSNSLNYVTHELRTPLNCIIQLLENNSKRNESIQIALQNCYYLLNFSNDLMDLAQIKVGKFKLVKNIFNLQNLINSCIKLFMIQSQKRKISLVCNYSEMAPQNVYNDEIRIKQVLINLISNAFKYTLNGTITIDVAKSNEYTLLIKIIDTGVGIRDEDKNKLLKAFGRVDDDESKILNRQGVGLGLLISNIICSTLSAQQQGIDIQSQLNKGSIFSFEIDYRAFEDVSIQFEEKIDEVKIDDEEDSNVDSYEIDVGSLPNIQKVYSYIVSKERDILIIDDDQFGIDSVTKLLNQLGVNQIDFAISCQHALTVLKEQLTKQVSYKIIFQDLEMPNVDGFNTQNEIKKLYRSLSISQYPIVIACSGYPKSEFEQEALNRGMNDYYEKPITKKNLQEIINKYLK